MASCTKVLLSKYITIGLQSKKNVLLGVTKVIGWLVWMGLMSAFQLWCEILEKQILSLFVGFFCWGQWVQFLKIHVFWGWILAILWPKVMKNYGIPEIRVFLGRILVILWPKVTNNYGVPEIHVFLGQILAFLWPKVTNNYGVPEIRVFLHPTKCSNFMLWVSFLAGVVNWK